MHADSKGFTLIELLVVIAIIAILAAVVILTLNPGQLLRQARDSNRISDLATLKSAIALYLSDVTSPAIGTSGTCYTSLAGASCTGRAAAASTSTLSGTFGVTGTNGWVPINFSSISSGSPLGVLPKDPTNSGIYFYTYVPDATNLVYELTAKMESTKYSNTGPADVESTDGGNTATVYEVGTDPGLDL